MGKREKHMREKRMSQAMRPRGRMGRIFGWLMGRANKPAYQWALDQLKAEQPKSILEIGFGTGALLRMAAKKLKPEKIAGVDPSDLMLNTAQKKLRKFAKRKKNRIAVDLKHGDDTKLPKDGPYDAILALHSFQFWSHPATSLAVLHSMLAPGGKLVMVLQLHGKRAKVPNPLSRGPDEITAACHALQDSGFTIVGMKGISNKSHGIVAQAV
jgi:cyclopropane fatty-acyl-phospholipid synthase-like methyltransferase